MQMRNNRCTIVSMNRYYENKFDRAHLDKFNERLLHDLRMKVREDICNFIIVECEGGRTLYLNKFIHIGITMGNFKCYSIEIRQPLKVCLQFNRNGRSIADITEIIGDLDRHPPPAKTILLDPTSLLVKNRQSMSEEATQVRVQTGNEQSLNLAELLQNKNVMELLKSSLDTLRMQPIENSNNIANDNVHFSQLQVEEPFFDNCPIYKPSKIIDYEHIHQQTFGERIREFKVFRSVDYKHIANSELNDFLKNFDIDKVIEKLRNEAVRKKILGHLKCAETPEQTVSNPKYPRNWEAIPRERPPLRNKRKKIITPKILRAIAEKKSMWMKAEGCTVDINNKMCYEDISSDESCDRL